MMAAAILLVSEIGEDEEAVVLRWYCRDGDLVEAGTVVCELMVQKASIEIVAPVSGRLSIAAAEEQVVTNGAVLGSLH